MEEGKRWKDLLAFLASLRGDLANVTAPPAFQAPSSAVELPICWAQRPSLFIATTLETDPVKRHLRVTEWILHSLKAQYYLGLDDKGSARKPLNAFLGELFSAEWTDERANTEPTADDVLPLLSHHPPITAARISNDEHKLTATGYTRVEMSFTGTFNVRQTGHIMLHMGEWGEDYLLPFPSCKMKGFLARKLYPELHGTHYIVSSTGLVSELNFSGEGFLTDTRKRNRVAATIYRASDPSKSPLYTLSGNWNKSFTVRDTQSPSPPEPVSHDINSPPPAPISIAPRAEQDPWESRRAWGGVIDAIERKELWKLLREKTRLEEAQRAMRREEKGRVWEQKFFTSRDGDEVFEKLAAKVKGVELQADRTKGVWDWDEGKARAASRPYRGGDSPFGYGVAG